jgi:hypothetical protein
MEAADIFVIYDCVQFQRRGYLHRNQLYDSNKNKKWLTLPLVKSAQTIKINELEFSKDAERRFIDQLRKFPIYQTLKDNKPLFDLLTRFNQKPINYISSQLMYFSKKLNITTKFVFSSSLQIDSKIKAQQRILAINKKLGSSNYINAPNGKHLYQQKEFNSQNIKLTFLEDYGGEYISVLESITNNIEYPLEKAIDLVKNAAH